MKKEAGNNKKGLIALVIILAVTVLALGGYILYYNFISDEVFCKGPICPIGE